MVGGGFTKAKIQAITIQGLATFITLCPNGISFIENGRLSFRIITTDEWEEGRLNTDSQPDTRTTAELKVLRATNSSNSVRRLTFRPSNVAVLVGGGDEALRRD